MEIKGNLPLNLLTCSILADDITGSIRVLPRLRGGEPGSEVGAGSFSVLWPVKCFIPYYTTWYETFGRLRGAGWSSVGLISGFVALGTRENSV